MLTFTNSLCLLSITNGNPQISWPPKLFLSICFVGLERYNETGGYCPICYDALAPSSLLRLGRSQLQQHRQRAALSTGDAGFLIFFSGITNVLVFDKPLVFKRLVSVLCFFCVFFSYYLFGGEAPDFILSLNFLHMMCSSSSHYTKLNWIQIRHEPTLLLKS